MLKNFIVLCCFAFLAIEAQSQTVQLIKDPKENVAPLEVEMLHLDAYLQFDTLEKQVIGKVTHTFKPLISNFETLQLDAASISVDSIFFNGKKCDNATISQKLAISLGNVIEKGKEQKIEIYYHCRPKSGLYFVGFEGKEGNIRSQIWTQGQGRNNYNWIPLVDAQQDKVTASITVDFDSKYTVISNGDLIEEKVLSNGLKRWRYEMTKPHSTYLMMLGIGKYQKTIVQTSAPEISYHYYPEYQTTERATFSTSDSLLSVLEEFLGVPFPWKTYTQVPVQNYFFGAMENTTATIFGDFFLTDSFNPWSRSFTEVSAHEFAHQWFGDYVTGETSTHQWIQEGFATYLSWIYQQKVEGESAYTEALLGGMNQVYAASVRDTFPLMHTQAGSGRHYYKAAWVLHMLQQELGYEAFQKSIQKFLTEHAYGTATTQDFQFACQRHATKDLTQFFDQWVYQPCEPILMSELKADKKEKKIVISQVQNPNNYSDFFSLNVEVWVGMESGQIKKFTTSLFQNSIELIVGTKEKIAWHFINPNLTTLSKVFVKQNNSAWKSILFNKNATPYMQLIALYTIDKSMLSANDIVQVAHIMQSNKVPMLDRSIAAFAAQFNTENALLDSIFKIGNATCIVALLNTWERIPATYQNELFGLLTHANVELRIAAFDAIQRSFPENIEGAIEQVSRVELPNTFKVSLAILAAKQQLNGLNNEEFKLLISYASTAFDASTRILALNLLMHEEQKVDNECIENLLEGAFHFQPSLMRKSREVLLHCLKNERIGEQQLFEIAKKIFSAEPNRIEQLKSIVGS